MNHKPLLAKILMTFLIIFVLLVGVNALFDFTGKKPATTQEMEKQSEIPPSPARVSSRWASDSAVLAIEENLKNLKEESQKTDLKELPLLPPILDLKITLEEKE